MQSGDWGAVVVTKHGVYSCHLEAHITAVPPERVNSRQNLTTLPAVINSKSHMKGVSCAIHWLNNAADWPHDEAYVMSRRGIFYRLRRIRGRRDGAPDAYPITGGAAS